MGEQEVGRGHQHCRGRGQAGEAPMLARTLLGLLARARVGTGAKARARARGHKVGGGRPARQALNQCLLATTG